MTTVEKITEIKNHRVIVTRHGGPEVLQPRAEHLPEPQSGEVRVRVLAAGISAYDLMHRRSGLLPGTPKPPFTLGEDIVGVVDKLGEGVSTLVELLGLLAAGKIKPIVAARIPLVEAAHAHELLESGGYAGKVVLVTDT